MVDGWGEAATRLGAGERHRRTAWRLLGAAILTIGFPMVLTPDAEAVPVGGEFQVNTTTAEDQIGAAVAMEDNGDFVAVWQSGGSGGSNTDIIGQRYGGDGVKVGGEFLVNTYTTDGQLTPDVAMDADGDFVVVWRSYGQDGSSSGVYGQRFTSTGAKAGAEFQVNTLTSGDQLDPAVDMDANGNFVVAWSGHNPVGFSHDVYIQRYSTAGVRLGGEVRANTFTSSSQGRPTIAMNDAGSFVVAWDSYAQDGSEFGVYLQRYDATGTPQGGELQANTFTAGYQSNPSAAMDEAGAFVVTWQSTGQDAPGSAGAFGRRYSALGVPSGSEHQINATATGHQVDPDAAFDGLGNLIVAWHVEDGATNDVFARRFDGSGSALGGDFQVNTHTPSRQSRGKVAAADDGDFVVVWDSFDQDGYWYGIYGQLFNRGTPEVCDGVDNDLDGTIDDGVTTTYYVDSDGDGHGDPATPSEACSPPAGHVVVAGDCDDGDPSVHPGATEAANDIDDDCDGDVDEGLARTWYADLDGDEFGDPDVTTSAAVRPTDHVADGTDCDDSSSAVNPAATEADNGIDDDCDGTIDEGFDGDADGFTPVAGGDADDADASVFPGAPELDDGKDNDQDGTVDEGHDADWDGYTPIFGGDCDDNAMGVHPGAAEADNGVDDDCDGDVDEGLDGDGDGYTPGFGGDCDDASSAVSPAAAEADNGVDDDCDAVVDEGFDVDGDGFTPVGGGDADDADASVFPGAPELDDGKDNDQDGTVDEGFDGDGDGYTPGFGGDCDDANAAVSPAAAEDDNGIDDDCDAAVDEGFDVDGDTYTPVAGGDADDADASVFPGAPELDDGKDNDQDGTVDEGLDGDGDGFTPIAGGDADDADASVFPGAPELDDGKDNDQDGTVDDGLDGDWDGYTPIFGGDCDDNAIGVNPGAVERDNGIDDDCDTAVDEGLDADGDGYTPVFGADCDDSAVGVNPGAVEMDNGIDDDCDAVVDEGFDGDGDGYTPIAGGDGDDTDATVHPGAAEVCDAKDNDQDGSTDEGHQDTDSDGVADCVDSDDDGDGIVDDRDPDDLRGAITGIPLSSFNSGGNKNAMLSRVTYVESRILADDLDGAVAELRLLRGRVDGCNGAPREKADKNDWITRCDHQRLVQGLIDELIANLAS
jgi:hypothetical protein